MKIRREEHMAGGNGHVIIKEILDAEQLNGKCGLYAQVTLEPGCSLGYHEHHGESETYYILQGQGEYNDNGYRSDGWHRRSGKQTRAWNQILCDLQLPVDRESTRISRRGKYE